MFVEARQGAAETRSHERKPALPETLCLILFVALSCGPAVYGFHLYALMWVSWRSASAPHVEPPAPAEWPTVTTQIPLFNELFVAERVIRAAAALDYPRDRHEIQVLDDSDDATVGLVARLCARLREDGVNIRVLRRSDRRDYKAGALAHGLAHTTSELVAIFDADFDPPPDFLRRLVPQLAADPTAGCVQARWGHLNPRESWITGALALGMDGHFAVEQRARAAAGWLLNFNGTAGIWRRAAIDDPRVGGWNADTLTEDLDLSYRAQLAGWRILYDNRVVAPGEIPADVDALKAQQSRWATGSIQTARKLLPAVWRSRLSLGQKIEATLHLTGYCVNLWMVLMAAFGRPLLAGVAPETLDVWLMWSWWLIAGAMIAPSVTYVYARLAIGGKAPWAALPKLVVLGLGLSLNNAVAVVAGLRGGRGSEFVRTPKTGASDSAGPAAQRAAYRAVRSRLWLYEWLLGGWCLVQWAAFLEADRYVGGSFLLLFAAGLFTLGWQSRAAQRNRQAESRPRVSVEPAA